MDFEYCISVEYGLSDWQIISRVGNKASFNIGGKFISLADASGKDCIYLRVIDENSGAPIIPWFKAKLLGNNEWSAEIIDLPEGGLYQLETVNRFQENMWIENGCRGQVVSHFGVGDIYYIVGQSNAAGTGLGIGEDAPMPGISNFKHNKVWELATHPLKDRHSPFIAFARKVYLNTGIPIGLCNFAVGGVPISRFLPEQNGDLYNTMLEVHKRENMIPKAILFYQGCSDAGNYNYTEDFKTFVNNIRDDLGNASLPIYTFQLNAHLDCMKEWQKHDFDWDSIREIQRRMPSAVNDLYVIPTIDAPMSDGIHNSRAGNIMLGERLAAYVLKYTYVKPLFATAPELDGITLTSEVDMEIKFKGVQSMIMIFHTDGEHVPLSIKDDNGDIPIGEVSEEFDTIKIKLKREYVGDVYVSCQTGARNKRYIQDLATTIPTHVFFNVKAERI